MAIESYGMSNSWNWSTLIDNTAWKVYICEVFLVYNFRHSDWIQRDAAYLSVFSPNAGKYWQEKLRIWKLFTQCSIEKFLLKYLKRSSLIEGFVGILLNDSLWILQSYLRAVWCLSKVYPNKSLSTENLSLNKTQLVEKA